MAPVALEDEDLARIERLTGRSDVAMQDYVDFFNVNSKYMNFANIDNALQVSPATDIAVASARV